MKIILATWNSSKVQWLSNGFEEAGFELTAVDPSLVEDADETGVTCEENAIIKVRSVGISSKSIVIGEDSALQVDALDGFPGVKTARWFPGTDDDRSVKLLEMLEDVPSNKRQARFQSAIALLFPDGKELTVLGTLEGKIATTISREVGKGYERIFEQSCGVPIMGSGVDVIASGDHRDKAIKLAIEEIKSWMQEAV